MGSKVLNTGTFIF